MLISRGFILLDFVVTSLFVGFFVSLLSYSLVSLKQGFDNNQQHKLAQILLEDVARIVNHTYWLDTSQTSLVQDLRSTSPAVACDTSSCNPHQMLQWYMAQIKDTAKLVFPEAKWLIDSCQNFVCISLYWDATSLDQACEHNNCQQISLIW